MRKGNILLLLALALLFMMLPGRADAASLKAKKLKESKVYKIDLNGGKKEKVKYTVTQGDEAYTDVFNLYVNGKLMYSEQMQSAGTITGVKAVDLITGDRFTELLVDVSGDSTCWIFVLRYINTKKVTACTKFRNADDPMCPLTTYRISSDVYKNTGKNKLYLKNDTPFMNQNFGCYYTLSPITLKSAKIGFKKDKSYKLVNVKEYTPDLFGGKYYKLKKDMTLYAKASKKKTVSTLKAGDTFVPKYVKPLKPEAVTYGDYTSYYYPLYVKVKTSDGKTGWLYFPAKRSSGTEGSEYLTALPAWG